MKGPGHRAGFRAHARLGAATGRYGGRGRANAGARSLVLDLAYLGDLVRDPVVGVDRLHAPHRELPIRRVDLRTKTVSYLYSVGLI